MKQQQHMKLWQMKHHLHPSRGEPNNLKIKLTAAEDRPSRSEDYTRWRQYASTSVEGKNGAFQCHGYNTGAEVFATVRPEKSSLPQQKSDGHLTVHEGGGATCNHGRPCGPTLMCHVHDLRLNNDCALQTLMRVWRCTTSASHHPRPRQGEVARRTPEAVDLIPKHHGERRWVHD